MFQVDTQSTHEYVKGELLVSLIPLELVDFFFLNDYSFVI
jgi:hypothetical protein